jgi:PilZ domain-containing protein
MEVSSRVTLVSPAGDELRGWALNVSRGGVRVILEEHVPLGAEYDVTVVDASGTSGPHPGRIVWVQDEPDGVVAGIEFRLEGDTVARGKS